MALGIRMRKETAGTNLIQQIKEAACISDVAAQYGDVRHSGPDRSVCRCLCGHNSDRHPSFMLYEGDNHFHCFACGRHGSVIDLVMLVENCNLTMAISMLKRRYLYGDPTQTPRRVVRPGTPMEAEKEVLPEVRTALNAAATHYQRILRTKPAVLGYLKALCPNGRGLDDRAIERLRVGYSDGQTLARVLHSAGINLGLAARIGLLSQYGESMCGRIVFPVLKGDDVVFMIGRTLQGERMPKYLGLSDGLVHKRPMQCGQPERGVIVVEGPFDYAALVQWGFDATYQLVALLGTGHTRAVSDLACMVPKPRVLIALDQDKAGQDAALRLMSALVERGLRVTVLNWEGAKDCGELLQRGELGKATFECALAKADP